MAAARIHIDGQGDAAGLSGMNKSFHLRGNIELVVVAVGDIDLQLAVLEILPLHELKWVNPAHASNTPLASTEERREELTELQRYDLAVAQRLEAAKPFPQC